MPPLYVIAGATATGKTALAVRLAQEIGGEIISADSMQIYKYMDVGTAKPTAEQMGGVPHHLISELTPDAPYSVAHFQSLAKERVADILSRGKTPVVCGGTGFYINALLYKEYDFTRPRPARSAENPRHTAESAPKTRTPAYDARVFVLDMPRPLLYARIDARAVDMARRGLADEVARLLEMGYNPNLPSMMGLGYKEFVPCARGEQTLAQATAALQIGTRRYAKRQATWFRHQITAARVDATAPTEAQLSAVLP